MAKNATLVKVVQVGVTRQRLRQWVNPSDIVGIIRDVLAGTPRVITSANCEACKADLERDNAAEVELS